MTTYNTFTTDDPTKFTPREWVDYCLKIEYEIMQAKSTTLHDGRSMQMEDLVEVQKARGYWLRQVAIEDDAKKGRRRIGGLRFKTASFGG